LVFPPLGNIVHGAWSLSLAISTISTARPFFWVVPCRNIAAD
jgi:hypothetical protein